MHCDLTRDFSQHTCGQEAVALVLALQRLGHTPSRLWAEAVLERMAQGLPTPTQLSEPGAPGAYATAAPSVTGNPAPMLGAAAAAAEAAGAAALLPPASVAGVVVALAAMRVRPSDGWVEAALAALHERCVGGAGQAGSCGACGGVRGYWHTGESALGGQRHREGEWGC